MNRQFERDRQLINITSKLPRKKYVKKFIITSLIGYLVYLNYSLITSDSIVKCGGFLNFMNMNQSELNALNIPHHYIPMLSGLIVLDILALIGFFIRFGPNIRDGFEKLWHQFPD